MSRRAENCQKVKMIKELTESIKCLKWQIPDTGVDEEIEQLKQSIRIASFSIK